MERTSVAGGKPGMFIERWVDEATRLANRGRTEEAIRVCHRVLAVDTGNLEARRLVIDLYMELRQWPEVVVHEIGFAAASWKREARSAAVESYRTILTLEEQLVGELLTDDSGELQETVEALKPRICYFIGVFFLDSGDHEAAVQYLRKSIELRSESWEAHLALGKAYMLLEMDKEAIDEFQVVSGLAPTEAGPAYEMLGEIFARHGRRGGHQDPKIWFLHAADVYTENALVEDAVRANRRALDMERRYH